MPHIYRRQFFHFHFEAVPVTPVIVRTRFSVYILTDTQTHGGCKFFYYLPCMYFPRYIYRIVLPSLSMFFPKGCKVREHGNMNIREGEGDRERIHISNYIAALWLF